MAEISKTPKKGLSLPEHYDPSVEKLRENMALIDSILQKANPNDLSSVSDGESDINALTTTGRYLVNSNATGYPTSEYAGIVDVFKVGTYILQEWRSVNSPTHEFRRYSTNSGSSWGSWTKDWNASNDGSGSTLDADLLDDVHGSGYVRDFGKSRTDFNSIDRNGFYQVSSAKNSPDGTDSLWGCITFQTDGGNNSTTYLCQIAIKDNSNGKQLYTRKKNGGAWTAWEKIWTSATDGTDSGLDADLLDGKHASAFVSSVKSTTSTDIDSITSEGMYEYTNITSTQDLPTFTGGGNTYGLIVKSVKGDSAYNCCFQILLKDGCSYIYMRYYYNGSWGSWENLNSTPSQLLTKIKTVGGSGSGLDADTVDNIHASALAGTNMSYYTSDTSLPNKSGIYILYTSAIEGSSRYYGITKAHYSTSNYTLIAVSLTSGKVFRKTYSQSSWSEITPLIPVVTSDPTSPSEGQLWILND